MGTRKQTYPSNVIHLTPKNSRVDVQRLLLDGQIAPTVKVPQSVQSAIDKRARELSEQAYDLCREHLQRRVAYHCEHQWPRVLNIEKAHGIIAQGGLSDALAHAYHERIQNLRRNMRSIASQSEKLAAETRSIVNGQDDEQE